MTDQFQERWHPHVTVAAIACRNGEYLIVRETIDGVTVLNQPAGHVDQNETLVQAVVRETREETGWGFEPLGLSGIYQYIAPNGETYFRFTFFGDLIALDENVVLDDPIDEVVFMDKTALESAPNLRSQSVLKCIEDYESGRRLPLDTVYALWEQAAQGK